MSQAVDYHSMRPFCRVRTFPYQRFDRDLKLLRISSAGRAFLTYHFSTALAPHTGLAPLLLGIRQKTSEQLRKSFFRHRRGG